MRFEKLFEPGHIGRLRLKNRIVMLPMGTAMCGVWGEVTDELVHWYARRAKGGTGLVIVQVCMAATDIDPLRLSALTLRADDDCFIPGLARLTRAIHDNGAAAGICLTAGGGVQARGGPWIPGQGKDHGVRAVSPSGVPGYGVTISNKNMMPRALTAPEIEKFVARFGQAAERISRADFDLIELHAYGGYLISQFLSPYFNRRADKYGGTIKKRCRFLLEIVEVIKGTLGADFPLTVKLSIDEAIPGGGGVEEGKAMARLVEKAGADGITCSVGVYGAPVPQIAPYYVKPGSLVHLAEAVKDCVAIPVTAIGRLDEHELADQVLRQEKADFIGIGRGLIADPDWPKKVENDQSAAIRKCLACNECSVAVRTPRPIRCSVNAAAGRESEYNTIEPATVRKHVVIAGGGPAGMEAARVAAIKGHDVTLFEASPKLGGLVRLGSVPPGKAIFSTLVNYYEAELKRLGVKLRLGVTATAETIARESPDVVIVATGGVPLVPDTRGITSPMVVLAQDILSGKKETGTQVVVVGGGSIGCEVANYLAEKGKTVTIVELLDKLASDMEASIRLLLLAQLNDKQVKTLTSTTIEEVTGDGVLLCNNAGRRSTLGADTVVIACGLKRTDGLFEELKGKVAELYVIGDAKQPRRIIDAISEGFTTAFGI